MSSMKAMILMIIITVILFVAYLIPTPSEVKDTTSNIKNSVNEGTQ